MIYHLLYFFYWKVVKMEKTSGTLDCRLVSIERHCIWIPKIVDDGAMIQIIP